jgi:hypothetical protein
MEEQPDVVADESSNAPCRRRPEQSQPVNRPGLTLRTGAGERGEENAAPSGVCRGRKARRQASCLCFSCEGKEKVWWWLMG